MTILIVSLISTMGGGTHIGTQIAYDVKRIKTFFIHEGKRINSEKYGLIDYLESRLNNMYKNLEASGTIDYQEVRNLKDIGKSLLTV